MINDENEVFWGSLALVVLICSIRPFVVNAATHQHTDDCYGSGCVKHSHIMSCGTISNEPSENAVAIDCPDCDEGYEVCNSTSFRYSAIAVAESSPEGYGGNGYYKVYCNTCGRYITEGGSWYGGSPSSSGYSYYPDTYGLVCKSMIKRCNGSGYCSQEGTLYVGTVRICPYGSGCSQIAGSPLFTCNKCGVEEPVLCVQPVGYGTYDNHFEELGLIGTMYRGYFVCPELRDFTGYKHQAIVDTCTDCYAGKKYITYTCGKSSGSYYNGNNVASATCNKVVVGINFK